MKSSDQLDQLAPALAKAQLHFGVASKDKTASIVSQKGSYKYSYADLPTVVAACRKELAANGLSVVQAVSAKGAEVTVSTRLLHASGQWLSDEDAPLTMRARDDSPQSIGSACTYARRYGLMTLVGVVADDEDDDAQAAQPPPRHEPPRRVEPAPPLKSEVDAWTAERFEAVVTRIFPGAARVDVEARVDCALDLMGCSRDDIPPKGSVWSLFATGPIHLRRKAIEAAEAKLAGADDVPEFKDAK